MSKIWAIVGFPQKTVSVDFHVNRLRWENLTVLFLTEYIYTNK